MTDKNMIAIDFDGVLHRYETPWTNEGDVPDRPVDGAFDALKTLALLGWRVIIHSRRCRYIFGTDAIKRWLKKTMGMKEYKGMLGIEEADGKFTPLIHDFTSEKPDAKILLDDRALQFNGNWKETLDEIDAWKCWRK